MRVETHPEEIGLDLQPQQQEPRTCTPSSSNNSNESKAAADNNGHEKPVILLVHGAFHQPVHYAAVLDGLRARGFTALAPALPTTGGGPELADGDDVAALDAVLRPLLDGGREVVVVAHDLGALPAGQCTEGESVAERRECGLPGGIRHYVNVCGVSFGCKGRNILGKREGFPLQQYHHVEDGMVHLLDSAKAVLYSGVASAQAEAAWPSVVRTHSLKSFNSTPRFLDSEMQAPKTYVLCERDAALAIEYQAYFIGVGAYDDVVRIPCGHEPFLEMPERIVEIICEIAARG